MNKHGIAVALLAQLGVMALAHGQTTSHGEAHSAQAEQDGVFTLGEITVRAPSADTTLPTGSILTQQELRTQNQETVGNALNLLPGVHAAYAGARGEQLFYVRGFDRLQVPVYIDGIPTYVPYDGRIDLGHFTTFDLSRVEVAKGFSSLIYGPNALGGAVNLITRRPVKPFEGEVGGGVGLADDGDANSYRLYTNIGGRQQQWWYQVGASYLKTDHFDLPGGFRPTNVQQGEGQRENSRRKDAKLSVKLGLTPNATDEYVFGIVRQDGEKGQPTYAGELPLTGTGSGMRARWWQWPQWDKTSYYFTSQTQLGAHTVRARLYHDQFKNTLVGYNYRDGIVGDVGSGFPSYYDDDTTGLSLEGDLRLSDRNLLRVAYHLKDDVHRSSDAGTPWTHFKDRTQSIAAEHTFEITADLALVAGISYNQRKSLSTRNYGTHAGSPDAPGLYDEPRGNNDAVNYQLGLFQSLGEQGQWGQLRASFANRTRFATMMERYSTRFGTVIPNPDLKAERARHYEIGYSAEVAPHWLLDAALFRSDVRDSIQTVRVAQQGDCTSTTCDQPQNVARARHVGVELGLQGDVGAWEFTGNYTWLRRKNLSSPEVMATDTPRHKLFASASWNHGPWKLTASSEAASQRYSSTNGAQVAHGFAVYHAKLGYTLAHGANLEAGVRNLGDRLYAYSEGYPMAGRNYFVNFNVPF